MCQKALDKWKRVFYSYHVLIKGIHAFYSGGDTNRLSVAEKQNEGDVKQENVGAYLGDYTPRHTSSSWGRSCT